MILEKYQRAVRKSEYISFELKSLDLSRVIITENIYKEVKVNKVLEGNQGMLKLLVY